MPGKYRKALSRFKRFRRAPKRFATRKLLRRKANVSRKRQVSLGKFFPDKALMTHKYVETVTITATTGAFTTYQFQCNGMFDPNSTGSGHQPMGFDQMAALYDHYTVIGSRIRAKVVPQATNEDGFRVGLYKEDDNSVIVTDMDYLAEQTPANVRMCAPNADTPVTLRSNFSLRRTYGGGDLLNNDRFLTANNADPAEQTRYVLAVQPITTAATVVTVWQVEIEYIAVWTELKPIGPS